MTRRRTNWPAATTALLVLAAGCSFGPPRVTFDGNGCAYEGPASLPAGQIELTFNNQSRDFAALALIELPADEARRSDELALVGGELVIPEADDAMVAGVIMAAPGEEVTEPAPLRRGSYVVDCTTFTGDRPSHAWRAAAIDVE